MIEDKYVESFKPGMMDVVYQWVNGASFAEVMKNTDIFEGESAAFCRTPTSPAACVPSS